MELVNGWLLIRMDDKRGVQLGSGQVISGDAYLDCKVIFKYTSGFAHTIENHPDPHMFIHKGDIICVIVRPSVTPKIINEP